MKEIKRVLNMNKEMKRKQYKLQNQFKDIKQYKQRNWRMKFSYGKLIDCIVESPLLHSKLNQKTKNKIKIKKKFFLKVLNKQLIHWWKMCIHKNYLKKGMNQLLLYRLLRIRCLYNRTYKFFLRSLQGIQ